MTVNSVQRADSSRYDIPAPIDRFSRNFLFVNEARRFANILECGCSTGFISRMMVAAGSRVVGIELDAPAAEQAKQFCARVLSIDLNQPDWTRWVDERFDLVTFGDVLEHLVDPEATLREARKVLTPGGCVLISLPNIAHWSMRLRLLFGRFEYESIGLLDHTHLRFYTVATAHRMIRNAGYRIRRFHPVFGGRFSLHFRPAWQRLSNRFPNLFAFQMVFLAEPDAGGTNGTSAA